jgi:hypothetical protein
MPNSPVHRLTWLGRDAPYLDKPNVLTCGPVVLGVYGGNTAVGAEKNEDAAFILAPEDGGWEFAALVDAHTSSDSAGLLIDTLREAEQTIVTTLNGPLESAFDDLERLILARLRSADFREKCAAIEGEASVLFVARKGDFLWWLNIGDVTLYHLNYHLALLGSYAVTQRSFYEWVGRHNTFDLAVPVYARGVRALRETNWILLATDGLLECGTRPFEDNRILYNLFAGGTARYELQASAVSALRMVHREGGKDSATVVVWAVETT